MSTLNGFEPAYAFVTEPTYKLSDFRLLAATKNQTANQGSNFHIETPLRSDFSRNPYLLNFVYES